MSQNTLLHQCIEWTCTNFPQVIQQHHHYFASLPEDVKDKLLAYMLRTQILTKDYLHAFLSPTRRHLTLDVSGDGGWLSAECFSTVAAHCEGLHSLSLAHCTQISTKELTEIVQACKELNAISLRGCTKLDDQSLRVIADNCKNLVYLDLFGVVKLTNAGVQHFSKSEAAAKLEFISLSNCMRLGNASLDALSLLPNLRELNLNTCPLLSSNGLVPLASGPAGKSLQAIDIRFIVHSSFISASPPACLFSHSP